MADTKPDVVAVTLSVVPTLEERVIDWLLARPEFATFTGVAIHAYGVDGRGLSTAEQVSGRQRRVELTMELQASAVEAWLDDLAAAFAAMDVGYRVTPILASGRLVGRQRSG